MWLWILAGLNIIIGVHGFSSGNVPQSCESMTPNHHTFVPNENDPPYHITYTENSDTGLIRVSLHANGSNKFTGFMLQAREGGERAVGTFIPVDAGDTTLLNCNGPDTAVTQFGRISRSKASFDWKPPASRSNEAIIFRATFVQSFTTFWVNVDLPLQTTSLTTAATSTEPSTRAGTTTPDLITSAAGVTTPELTTSAAGVTTPELTTSAAGVTTPDLTTSAARVTTPELTTSAAGVTTPLLSVTSADVTTTDLTNPTADVTTCDCTITTAWYRKTVSVLMVVDSILVVLKMGTSIIIMATVTNCPVSRLLKRMSTVYCHVACEGLEVAALVLSLICGSKQVFALLCVVVSINVTVVVFYFLPLGHSHELKKMFKVVAQVFSVTHEAFIVAPIYVAYLELVGAIKNRRASWPLWVLIVYTVWILLFIIWVIVLYTLRGSYRLQREQKKKKHRATAVTAVTTVFISGAVVFGISIIIGILQHPEY